jgi:hypothetical protein
MQPLVGTPSDAYLEIVFTADLKVAIRARFRYVCTCTYLQDKTASTAQ